MVKPISLRIVALAAAALFFAGAASAQTASAGAPAVAKLTQTPPQTATTPAETVTASAAPAPALVSDDASQTIRNFYVQLTDTMKQGDQLGFSGRYKKLQPAITSAFNLPLMTRFAVGLDWAKATPQEQQQLVSAFSDFSVATYANQFKTYDGEAFKVVDEKSTPEGILVETTLTPKEGSPVALNYLMKPDDQGHLRIVDVFLDGAISQLAAQRSQFTSIVRREGIPALVNSLGDKARQMGPS